jgi:hypothetical protein
MGSRRIRILTKRRFASEIRGTTANRGRTLDRRWSAHLWEWVRRGRAMDLSVARGSAPRSERVDSERVGSNLGAGNAKPSRSTRLEAISCWWERIVHRGEGELTVVFKRPKSNGDQSTHLVPCAVPTTLELHTSSGMNLNVHGAR